MSRSAATEILADLRHRKVRVRAVGDRLRLKAPPGVLSPGDRDALSSHKTEMLAQLERENRLLGFSLTDFEQSGCPLEIDVPGLGQTLWFVPRDGDAGALLAEGVRRGRIWTAAELRDIVTAPGLTPEDVIRLAQAKLVFNAEVVDVRPAEPHIRPATPAEELHGVEPVQASLDLDTPSTREFD